MNKMTFLLHKTTDLKKECGKANIAIFIHFELSTISQLILSIVRGVDDIVLRKSRNMRCEYFKIKGAFKCRKNEASETVSGGR